MNESVPPGLPGEIKALLVETLMLPQPPDQLAEDQPLFGPGGLGLDSVDALQIVVALDKAYGLKIQDVGQAHESLEATFEGEPLTVAFNPEYLVDGIEVAPGDEITLETVDALKPALVRGDGEADFLYLLMPVRVS